MPSRDLKLLTPKLRELYGEWAKLMACAGLWHVVTSTLRTMGEQEALFAQGRKETWEVNDLRRRNGMPAITVAENKRKVTWTMNSRHLPGSDGLSHAFDFALSDPTRSLPNSRKVYWDTKVSLNDNDIPDYLEAGMLAEKVGLVWGGRWKTPDYPHIELPL